MTGIKEKSKPKVLFFLNRLVIGGSVIDIISMADLLLNDFEILIAYGEKEDHEIEAQYLLNQFPSLRVKKIKSLKRTPNPFYDIIAFWNVLKLVLNFKPQIVHTHGAKSGLIGRIVAFICRVPVIVHTYHGHVFHSYYNSIKSKGIVLIERLLALISTNIICLSEYQKLELIGTYKITNATKLSVIPLGINQEYFLRDADKKRSQFRERYSLKETDFAIGIVGRIVPIKNHIMFLEAAIELIKNGNSNLYFFVVGDGNHTLNIQKFLRKNKTPFSTPEIVDANARVIFTSWLTDIAMVHHGLDIVTLTSNNEGTPLSLIEAQFCGKPVVSTNVGGVKDIVLDGETGYLVDANDVGKFIANINNLIDDKVKYKKISTNAHIFAQKNFSLQAQVERTKGFYFKSLENKK